MCPFFALFYLFIIPVIAVPSVDLLFGDGSIPNLLGDLGSDQFFAGPEYNPLLATASPAKISNDWGNSSPPTNSQEVATVPDGAIAQLPPTGVSTIANCPPGAKPLGKRQRCKANSAVTVSGGNTLKLPIVVPVEFNPYSPPFEWLESLGLSAPASAEAVCGWFEGPPKFAVCDAGDPKFEFPPGGSMTLQHATECAFYTFSFPPQSTENQRTSPELMYK